MGTLQSPIRLDRAAATEQRQLRAGLHFGYAPARARVKNTGHGAQVLFEPGQQAAVLDSRKAQLLQFHFHTPSEHALDGERSEMEAHLGR